MANNVKSSQYPYFDRLENYLKKDSRWLDVGCGNTIIYDWIPNGKEREKIAIKKCHYVVGLDYSFIQIKNNRGDYCKLVGDIENLPFRSSSFDVISSNMVVEHIRNETNAISEIHRILSDGGIFLFHTPNLLNYGPLLFKLIPQSFKNKLIHFLEGRTEDSTFPTCYKMNTVRKIEDLLQGDKFEIIKFDRIQSSPLTLVLGPLVIFELMIMKLLSFNIFKNFRSNFIVATRKK